MALSTDKIWERDGAIGILALPTDRGSYLHEPQFMTVEQLEKYFNEHGLKGIIIRGSGRHFSGGADLARLRQLAQDEALLFEKMTAGKRIISLIENSNLPIVAEISGACFGGGLEIALACHIRICGDNAIFAFPEVSYNIMPGLGGTISLSKVIGPGKAAEVILSGDAISSDKALKMNIVDYKIPVKELHDFSIKYLRKLTNDRDIDVIRSVMQSIRNSQVMDPDSALKEETRLFCALAVRNMKV